MVWVRLKPEVLSIEELVFGTRLAGACRSDLIPRIFLCRTVYFPIVFFLYLDDFKTHAFQYEA